MPPRRLLFYIHSLAGGGGERVFARLASGFARRGDEVVFVVEREAGEWMSRLDSHIEFIVLPKGHLSSTLGLARLLREKRPDAAFAALSAANFKLGIAAALAGRLSRTIVTYHGFFENEPGLLSRIGYLSTPLLCRAVAASVAVSNALRNDMMARFYAPADKVVVLYNPALPSAPPPALDAAALGNRPPGILGIGRLVPDKGYLVLLKAFARLADKDATLTILGVGPQRDALLEEARALGVEQRFFLPGFGDPAVYLSNARCFALASSYETFSLALVEALAYGLPVVITASGGPTEIVNAHGLGAIVAVNDIDAMAQALAQALARPGDPLLRQRRAADFSLDAALDGYDALIRRVIAG